MNQQRAGGSGKGKGKGNTNTNVNVANATALLLYTRTCLPLTRTSFQQLPDAAIARAIEDSSIGECFAIPWGSFQVLCCIPSNATISHKNRDHETGHFDFSIVVVG